MYTEKPGGILVIIYKVIKYFIEERQVFSWELLSIQH